MGRLEKGSCHADIGSVITKWIGYRFVDFHPGCKMYGSVDITLADQVGNAGFGAISLDEFRVRRDTVPAARRQIVDNDDRPAPREECERGVRTHIAGTAGQKYLDRSARVNNHIVFTPLRRNAILH